MLVKCSKFAASNGKFYNLSVTNIVKDAAQFSTSKLAVYLQEIVESNVCIPFSLQGDKMLKLCSLAVINKMSVLRNSDMYSISHI